MTKVNCNEVFKVPEIAWKSVLLFSTSVLIWSFAIVGSVAGFLSLAIAMLLSLPTAFVAFTGLHEASHFAFGRKRWISVLFGECCALILLGHFQAFREIHLRHHRHTNDPDNDPDSSLGSGAWWMLLLRWFTVDWHYFFEHDPSKVKATRWELRASWLSVITMLTGITFMLITGNWTSLVFCWWLPARISLALAIYYSDFIPHNRPHAIPKKQNQLNHTFNTKAGFLEFFLLGHHLHLIHHIYPSVPFYQCKKIWELRKTQLTSKGATSTCIFQRQRLKLLQ
jgi:beta-carotene hydroxylase